MENSENQLQIYQVAAERFNVIHQQSQTAINISTVSVMAFGAIEGAIFASLGSARPLYRFYAAFIMAFIAVLSIGTSIVCRQILNRSQKTTEAFEDYMCNLEDRLKMPEKPHQEFRKTWKEKFSKYEPYKATSILLIINAVINCFIILGASYNIWFLLIRCGLDLVTGITAVPLS